MPERHRRSSVSIAAFMLLITALGVLTFVLVGLVASYLSTDPVLQAWEQEEGERFQSEISQELNYIAGVYGQLQSRDVQERLQYQLNRDEFVILYSPDERLVLWAYDSLSHRVPPYSSNPTIQEIHANTADLLSGLLEQGRWNGVELDPARSSRDLFDYLDSRQLLQEIQVDDETRAFVFTGIRQLGERDLFTGLAQRVGLSVAGSLGAALIISLLLILILSRQLRAYTTGLAGTVKRIATGARDETVRRGPIRELNDIARATEQLQRDLATREQSLHAWARHAAHDLRTPLTALSVQLDALIDGVAQPSIETFEKMHERTEYLAKLANEFLMFTKIDEPGYTFERVECDTRDILNTARGMMPPGRLRLPELNPPQLCGDPLLITRCFQNLFHNAVTHGSGEVTVDWTREPEHGRVTFTVINNVANDRLHEGYGLGLSIVRTIARLHGGTFEYRAGKGQVNVSLSLPEWPPV